MMHRQAASPEKESDRKGGNKMKTYDVVGIGDLCLDITAGVPKIPETDMAQRLLFQTSQGGGKVPTAMVALSRLGASCTLFATYGGDGAGRYCRQELADAGVDTGHMVCLKQEATNLTFCLAEQQTGGRSCIGSYGLRGILPEELDRGVIETAKYLHLWKMTPAALLAAEWIHEAGGRVVFDADRYEKETEEHIGITDVFICSEFFFREMCGEAQSSKALRDGLKRIRSRGPKTVIVTRGAKGYAGIDADGYFEGSAFTEIEVVDSTGAGDVFHGAYIYGLLQEKDARESARYAAAVAAIKCTRSGGRTGIPDARTTELFLESGTIDPAVAEKWSAYYKAHALI